MDHLEVMLPLFLGGEYRMMEFTHLSPSLGLLFSLTLGLPLLFT